MNRQYQVTLTDKNGQHRPVSTVVEITDRDLTSGNVDKKFIINKGVQKICAKHYWSNADLQREGYTRVKIREYNKEKIEAEKAERYERIKEEKYASGEWKRPKNKK